MKQIKYLLAIVAAIVTAPVQAQQYAVSSVSVTNTIAASTTDSTASSAITLTKHDQVAFLFGFKGTHEDDTAAVTLTLAQSLDASTWATAGRHTLAVASNGTNFVYVTTNLTVNALGYLRVHSIQNAATNAITNIVVKFAVKPKKDG